MRWLNQVSHLMHDHILDQVFWFLDQFRVQTDMSRFVIAASPFGFHSLEKISNDFNSQLRLPLTNERRDELVDQRLVPVMDDRRSFFSFNALLLMTL